MGEKENVWVGGRGAWGSGRRAWLDAIERHGLVVDRARNRPTSQMVGSVEGIVPSVARKREREREGSSNRLRCRE